MQGDSEYPLNGPVIPFGAMVEDHTISAKTHRNYINLVQKFCQVYSSVVLYAVRNWKREIMFADIEELKERHIRTPRPKAQCNGIHNVAKKWKLEIPSRRWNNQNLW